MMSVGLTITCYRQRGTWMKFPSKQILLDSEAQSTVQDQIYLQNFDISQTQHSLGNPKRKTWMSLAIPVYIILCVYIYVYIFVYILSRSFSCSVLPYSTSTWERLEYRDGFEELRWGGGESPARQIEEEGGKHHKCNNVTSFKSKVRGEDTATATGIFLLACVALSM